MHYIKSVVNPHKVAREIRKILDSLHAVNSQGQGVFTSPYL